MFVQPGGTNFVTGESEFPKKKWSTDDDIIIWLMKNMKNDKNIWRISNLTMIYYFYILSIIINNCNVYLLIPLIFVTL